MVCARILAACVRTLPCAPFLVARSAPGETGRARFRLGRAASRRRGRAARRLLGMLLNQLLELSGGLLGGSSALRALGGTNATDSLRSCSRPASRRGRAARLCALSALGLLRLLGLLKFTDDAQKI